MNMKKRNFIIALALCTSLVSYAQQQVEQAAIRLAETQHRLLSAEISNALTTGQGRPAFGGAGNDQQFFLAENEQIFSDFLGWRRSQFDRRNLSGVYQALSSATRQRDANRRVAVRVSFPLNENATEFVGQAQNRAGRDIRDTYTVITRAEVAIEASRQGADNSVAKNYLTLNWEVLIRRNRAGAIDTRSSRATLSSVTVEPATGFFESEMQQMQTIAENLINGYFQALRDGRFATIEIPIEWINPLQNSVRRETEGNVFVSLPSSSSFDVRTVPDLKIFVDQEAFHRVDLGFNISIDDDLRSGRITRVDYRELERPIIVEQQIEVEPEIAEPVTIAATQPSVTQPVFTRPTETGATFRVQILSLLRHVAISDLPQLYRLDDLIIERYVIEGVNYYKYVVPAGTTMNEALSVMRQLQNRGIEDAWIAVYRDGARVNPNVGMPEIVR